MGVVLLGGEGGRAGEAAQYQDAGTGRDDGGKTHQQRAVLGSGIRHGPIVAPCPFHDAHCIGNKKSGRPQTRAAARGKSPIGQLRVQLRARLFAAAGASQPPPSARIKATVVKARSPRNCTALRSTAARLRWASSKSR